jgi:hypothetical protein
VFTAFSDPRRPLSGRGSPTRAVPPPAIRRQLFGILLEPALALPNDNPNLKYRPATC